MNKLLMGLLLVFGAVCTAWAHHPFSSEFDGNRPVTLTGTVSSVNWADPHVYITMDAKDGNGATTSWKLEGASSRTLEQQGWKGATLKEGDRITVAGYRAIDGSNLVSVRSIKVPDGRTLVASDATEDGGPQPAGTIPTTLPSTASNTTLIGVIGLCAIAAAMCCRRSIC